jgi:F0F1-type ATP synthase assembly protein I
VRRWSFVGGTGVLSGAFLGWLVDALTGSAVAGLVAGTAIASILVVLAVGGFRQSAAFAVTDQRAVDALARRARVQDAMRATRQDDPKPGSGQ